MAGAPPSAGHRSPEGMSTPAQYARKSQKYKGRLEIINGHLVYSIGEKAGFRVFMGPLLRAFIPRYQVIEEIALTDITSAKAVGPNTLAVTTADQTLSFQLNNPDLLPAWVEIASGRGAPAIMPLDPHAPMVYPDDDAFCRVVRTVDNVTGQLEQGFLFVVLAAIVVVASMAALSDKVLHDPLGRWWFVVVRGGTFSIAMIGAVFATHQQRHLAMDLISRQLPPAGRLILGMALKVFVMVVMVALFRSGLHQRETVGGTGEEFISDKTVVTTLPVGAALVIYHSVLHFMIDFDYLVRGVLPPERMRSAH